jgi:acyl-CoA dehydrogenase
MKTEEMFVTGEPATSRVGQLEALADDVARGVVASFAADVDRRARFPKEAIDALRDDRLLSVLVPAELGGDGATIEEVSAMTTSLSRACASTGMVFAMHQIQVACLVQYGGSQYLTDYVAEEVVGKQVLLASATTEVGTGGDIRSSRCAVEIAGATFCLDKQAPVISYGSYADAVLATARRGPDRPESDQVLVLCQRPGLVLSALSEWDTLGFRGTCSQGFELHATGPIDAILPEEFGSISAETMLPVSHLLWSSVWVGIAQAAVAQASQYVRQQARRRPGTMTAASTHLADLVASLQQFEALLQRGLSMYAQACDSGSADQMELALFMNGLKVTASKSVLDITVGALGVCGIEGYREDSPFSLGRLIRDAHGAALMVSNDRITAHSAQMLLVMKEM